jgi:hypothetical protein
VSVGRRRSDGRGLGVSSGEREGSVPVRGPGDVGLGRPFRPGLNRCPRPFLYFFFIFIFFSAFSYFLSYLLHISIKSIQTSS